MPFLTFTRLSKEEKAELAKKREIAKLQAEAYRLQDEQAANLKAQKEIQSRLESLI